MGDRLETTEQDIDRAERRLAGTTIPEAQHCIAIVFDAVRDHAGAELRDVVRITLDQTIPTRNRAERAIFHGDCVLVLACVLSLSS